MDRATILSEIRNLVPDWLKFFLLKGRGLVQGKWPLSLAQYTLRKSGDMGTLTGKIRMKMAFDRDPLLTTFADKLLVRQYVSEAVGHQYLPDLIANIGSPQEIWNLTLPYEFALKSNNGSGAMILAWRDAPRNVQLPNRLKKSDWGKYLVHPDTFELDKAAGLAELWFNQNFYYRAGYFPEWAYRNIKTAVIVEELMLDENGGLPSDFKFFMVHGKCNFIQVDSSRYQKHRRDLFTPEWERIEGTYKYPASGLEIAPPKKLQEMLSVAETLSREVDFLRVDLYETSKGVKFGELTNYPGGGIEKFNPKYLDEKLGSAWKPKYSSPK